jgi:chromate reductase
MRVIGVCGSLQASSSNLDLLRAIGGAMPPRVEFAVYDGLRRLPQFDPDLEAAGTSPPAVVELRAVVAAADALVIASPEYGHSLPGSLKNAIDWMIGSGELERKIVGVTSSVAHAARGRKGLEALLGTLAAVSAEVIGGVVIVRAAEAAAQISALANAVVEAADRRASSTVAP